MLSIFPCVSDHLFIFFGEMSVQVFCPFFDFFFLILICMGCLYILEINPRSLCLQIFSPILQVVFTFCLWFPLLYQRFLSLISSCLFLFSLLQEVYSKRYCCHLCQSILPMFSSKSFIVSSLKFRSLIHFYLFLCMVLESVLITFFYLQLSSFPSTSY